MTAPPDPLTPDDLLIIRLALARDISWWIAQVAAAATEAAVTRAGGEAARIIAVYRKAAALGGHATSRDDPADAWLADLTAAILRTLGAIPPPSPAGPIVPPGQEAGPP